jgi:hypothetical protein
VIQTLQRICALPAVTDTELPFRCMAAQLRQKLRAHRTRPATDLQANIGLCARPATANLPMPLLMMRIDVVSYKSNNAG